MVHKSAQILIPRGSSSVSSNRQHPLHHLDPGWEGGRHRRRPGHVCYPWEPHSSQFVVRGSHWIYPKNIHHHPHFRSQSHAHCSLRYTNYSTVAGLAGECCSHLAGRSTAVVRMLFVELPVPRLCGWGSQSSRVTSGHARPIMIRPWCRCCRYMIGDWCCNSWSCRGCTLGHAHDSLHPLDCDSPARFPGCDGGSHSHPCCHHDVQVLSQALSLMAGPSRS